MAGHDELAAAFAHQGEICAAFGAPLYAELCRRCATDILHRGPIAALVGSFDGDPGGQSLALRLLGAVHARVQAGAAPELAVHYPSVGGTPRWPAAWDAFVATVTHDGASLQTWLQHPPQTNEVGRSAALAAGFLQVAAATRQPLHLLELGSSAGLNLRWDRYGHRFGDARWGDASSPVQLQPQWSGAGPPLVQVQVNGRRGVDLRPIDVRDAAARARLLAFVWPDHTARLRTLEAALVLAQCAQLRVGAGDAADWIEARMREPRAPGAWVVFHSSVWFYLPVATRQRIETALAEAGRRSTSESSLHWLRWEDEQGRADHGHGLWLRSWPGDADGGDLLLARGQPHGRYIEWLGGPAPTQPITR